ncbi:MAG: preprotein translocase subunit SecE [Elusimicrobiota bacterium]
MFNKIIQFLRECVEEMKKVTWLGKKEVFYSTIAVIALVVTVGIFVGFIDFILSVIMKRIL